MKSILGTLALGLFLSLAYGALGLYEVSRDKAIAPNQAMASAYIHHHYGGSGNHPSSYRCDYTFQAGGNTYVGQGTCPAAGTAKELLEGLAGVDSSTGTIYYDPNDPSYNSLVDFSVKADDDYMKAKVGFGLALACALLLGIGVVIAAKASQPGGGIMVDAKGTMLYPDQIKSDPGDERFSAHPTHISSEEND